MKRFEVTISYQCPDCGQLSVETRSFQALNHKKTVEAANAKSRFCQLCHRPLAGLSRRAGLIRVTFAVRPV